MLGSVWLPEDLSGHGGPIDLLVDWVHVFMAVLFVGWGLFFVYCLIRFRYRPGHRARYEPVKAKVSKYVEVAVVVIEAAFLLGMAMPVLAKYKNEPPSPSERLEVRVVAEQFAWNFHYPGPDGLFGRTSPELIDAAINPIGLDDSDPAASDDLVEVGNLTVPVDKPIYLRLSSKDVIHCFSVTELRLKQDVIPGMEIPIWFTAKSAGDRGKCDIMCAQLCGANHYTMKGEVHLLPSEDAFDQWYVEQQVNRTTMPGQILGQPN